MFDQTRTDTARGRNAHVDDDGLTAPCQAVPIQIRVAVLGMPADKGHGGGMVAMGQRDAGIGGATGGRGDARYDLDRDAARQQIVDLLAATSEDERIAALEPDHTLAGLRATRHQGVDFILWNAVVGLRFTDVKDFCVGPGEFQDAGPDQAVVDHDVGVTQHAQRPQGHRVRRRR